MMIFGHNPKKIKIGKFIFNLIMPDQLRRNKASMKNTLLHINGLLFMRTNCDNSKRFKFTYYQTYSPLQRISCVHYHANTHY